MLACAGPVVAAGGQRNAATWYGRAIDRLDRFDEGDWELVDAWLAQPDADPPAALRHVLADAGPLISLARRGSVQPSMDFELDYALGFELLLPHLSPLRRVGRLMSADALLRLHDGDSLGAAEEVAALYRIADHLKEDRVLISSLVGQAMFAAADRVAEHGLDRAAFNAADGWKLLRGLEGYDRHDPFGIVEGLAGEQQWVGAWLEDRYGHEDGPQGLGDVLAQWGDEERARALDEMDAETFAGQLVQYDGLMGEIVIAFDDEDPEAGRARLDELEAELLAGEHGLLARSMIPSMGHLHDRLLQGRALVSDRMASLTELAEGRAAPGEMANAAVLYLQAAKTLAELPPERRDPVLAFDPDPDAPLDDPLAATLAEAGPVLDLVREGASKRRCDFAFARRGRKSWLGPAYPGALRDLFRLLHADTLRTLRAGDAEGTVERLHLACRLIAALGADEPLLSTLVAHACFDDCRRLVEAADARGLLDDERRRALLDDVRALSAKDPFGYLASVKALRAALTRDVGRRRAGPGVEADEPALLAGWDGDRLLALAAMLDVVAGQAGETVPPPHRGLRDVLDAAALEAVREQAYLASEAVGAGRIEALPPAEETPSIGRVPERRLRARRDLRRTIILLTPPRCAPAEDASSPPDGGAATDDGDPAPGD
jgi:hypothetical protein